MRQTYRSHLRKVAAPPPAPTAPAATRDKAQSFWTSAPGIAILGFLLSTVLGSILTEAIKAVEENRQRVAQSISEENAGLERLRSVVNLALARRAALTDALFYDLGRSDADADIGRLWPVYRQTVIDGSASLWQSFHNLEEQAGRIDSDGAAMPDRPAAGGGGEIDAGRDINVVLSNYTFGYLVPKLEDEDACIKEAHDDYFNHALPKPDRIAEAGKSLAECRTPEWDELRICVHDITYFFEQEMALQSAVLSERRGWLSSIGGWGDSACSASDRSAYCRKERFYRSLPAKLRVNCGPRPGGD